MDQDLRAKIERMLLGIEQVIADVETAQDITYSGYDGELLSQSGDHYTYQYLLRTEWEPEENSRIYIELDKRTRKKLAAKVISRVGTALMLSTREPIPVHCLKKATLIEDTVWLLERQQQVLRQYLDGSLEEAPGGFGAKVLELRPVHYGRKKVESQIGSFVPNERQLQAIEHGLGSEVTFVVGAAGTGKSRVQALLASHFLKQGLTILPVSHTNIATDHLFLDLVQFIEQSGDAGLLRLLHSHRLVRAGDPRHVSLRTGAYRHLTVSAIAEARMGDLAPTRLRLEEARQVLAQRIKGLEQSLQRHEARWQAEYEQLKREVEAFQAILAQLMEQEQRRIEGIQQRIVEEQKKQQQTREQLAPLVARQEDLDRQMRWWQGDQQAQSGYPPARGERARRNVLLETARQEVATLERRGTIKRLLAGRQHELEVVVAQREVAARQDALYEADRVITALAQDIQRNRQEQRPLRVTIDQAETEIRRLRVASASTSLTDQMAPYQQNVALLLKNIQAGEADLDAQRARVKEAKDERERIDARLMSLKVQLASLKTQVVADAQLVATTATGVYLNHDLLQQRVDVVMIDEISMLSMIAALLVSMRATKYVIASGDTMQLLPILKTECSEQEREQKMPEAVKWLGRDLLSYRGITIFDAIAGTKGCVLLREQGRMHPKILAPINHHVYQDMLTSRPETEVAPPIAPLPSSPLMLVDSSQSSESRTYKPSKYESRVNDHHVKVAVTLIPQILATLPERAAIEDPTVPRIGVLTPYRSQARRLLKAMHKADLAQYVHVGTINIAQALQFEVVIVDTVEAPGLRPFRFTWDRILDGTNMATDATRRLNVGHTRARHKLIYLANLNHLRAYKPENPNDDPKKRRLLFELAEWAGREGSISSLDVLRSASSEGKA